MDLLEWDAATYDTLELPHRRWGAGALERLGLRGDETVLELGCGSGRDTERLLGALPHGRVVAVDGSQQMLDQLRRRLGDQDGRLEVVYRDLREPLRLDGRFDAVLSVATLHWLPDHQHVFDELARVMRPGARLSIDAGGRGNIDAFREVVRATGLDDGAHLWNFADIPDTRARLQAAGMGEISVQLAADDARLDDRAQLQAFVATVMLAAALRALPVEQRAGAVSEVCDRLVEPVIDFVRLQVYAVRNAVG